MLGVDKPFKLTNQYGGEFLKTKTILSSKEENCSRYPLLQHPSFDRLPVYYQLSLKYGVQRGLTFSPLEKENEQDSCTVQSHGHIFELGKKPSELTVMKDDGSEYVYGNIKNTVRKDVKTCVLTGSYWRCMGDYFFCRTYFVMPCKTTLESSQVVSKFIPLKNDIGTIGKGQLVRYKREKERNKARWCPWPTQWGVATAAAVGAWWWLSKES
jgi:hypothetical protein